MKTWDKLQQIQELHEWTLILRMQTQTTQDKIREMHKNNPEAATKYMEDYMNNYHYTAGLFD